MKKLLILILSLIFGTAAFAKPFIAFTNEESFEIYRGDIAQINTGNDWATKKFEEGMADKPKREWKYYTFIVVFHDVTNVVVDFIWVYTEDFRSFGINIATDQGNIVKNYHVDTFKESDPVQVGLNFIDKKVHSIVSVVPVKVIYLSEDR